MVAAMCAAVDAGEAAAFAAWFSDDATYRFANAPALRGRDAVKAATEATSHALPWVRHTVDQVAHVDNQMFCRFTITTADPAGRQVDLPCVTVMWVDNARIVDYRVHIDVTPAIAT
jgi:uncharacterized protein (TIGR02246 family)